MIPNENKILASYLAGWKESRKSLLDTLAYVPDDQLAEIVRSIRHEHDAIA